MECQPGPVAFTCSAYRPEHIEHGQSPPHRSHHHGALHVFQGDARWVDRYLYEKPDQLRNFLGAVRRAESAPIRLLGKPEQDYASERARIASPDGVPDVDARVMAYQDRPALHDRHLFGPAYGRRYVLPLAAVIIGTADAGSAIAVKMPSIDFDYEACWSRATPLV